MINVEYCGIIQILGKIGNVLLKSLGNEEVEKVKKKIGALGMMLVFTSVALISQEARADQEDTSLLSDLEEINTIDSMVDRNGWVFYTIKEIMADGTSNSYTIYQDKTRFVSEDDYALLIEENGDVYGMDTELDLPIRYLFIGDTYEEFVEEYKRESIYEYDEEEKITSKEVKDGVLYLETELAKESYEEYYTAYGYTSDDVDYILSEYEIDSETKEIFEIKTYVILGEEKTLLSDVILDKECEEYVLDQEITDGVFGSDSRTVSVVTDTGTTDEKVYIQTVAKGSSVIIYIPEEFEETIYADAEYTEEIKIDRMQDQTAYLKRIEE